MNTDNSNFYNIPGNDYGIEVPRIEKPFTHEKLATIRRYIDQIVNHQQISTEYYQKLEYCYFQACSQFLFPQVENPTVDQLATIMSQHKIIDKIQEGNNKNEAKSMDRMQKATKNLQRDINKLEMNVSGMQLASNNMDIEIGSTQGRLSTMFREITTMKTEFNKMKKDMKIMQETIDKNYQELNSRLNKLETQAIATQRNLKVINFDFHHAPVCLRYPMHVPIDVRALAFTESELFRLNGKDLDKILSALDLPIPHIVDDKKTAIRDHLHELNQPLRNL